MFLSSNLSTALIADKDYRIISVSQDLEGTEVLFRLNSEILTDI
jgi:hypothetical protein